MYPDYTARHFRVLRQAIETGIFKFLAHLDYVRKYGDEIYNVNLFTEEKQAILAALKKTNTGIEISTKGLRKIGCFYPDGKVLEQVKLLNIPVVISDDAHTIYELGADFDKAEAELKKYNIINRLKF